MKKSIFSFSIIWLTLVSTSFSQNGRSMDASGNIDTVVTSESKIEGVIRSAENDSLSAIKGKIEQNIRHKSHAQIVTGITGQAELPKMRETEGQTTGIDSVSDYYQRHNGSFDTLLTHQEKVEKFIGMKDSLKANAGSAGEVAKKYFDDRINDPSVSEEIPKVDSLANALGEARKNFESQAGGLDIDSIAKRFDQAQFPDLPVLSGSEVKTRYLPVLDSLREQHLSEENLKLVEKAEDTLGYKEVLLKEKPLLKQKLFFEGILGFNSNNLNMVSISPSIGIMLTRSISTGIGLNYGADITDIANNNVIGVRSFVKYELIEKKFYLQAEDNMSLAKISDIEWEEGYEGKAVDHVILIGAGLLINYSASNSLNIVMLYQVNERKISSDFASPFTLRLGLSIFNKK